MSPYGSVYGWWLVSTHIPTVNMKSGMFRIIIVGVKLHIEKHKESN